jgi:hypothetical protein
MNLWRCLSPQRRALLAAFLMLALAARASAQTLSPATISATPIGAKEQADIDQYVDACVKLLIEGSDEEVARGRERLLDPFQKGGTPAFRTAYMATIARAMANIAQAERPITRLNAMIVLTRVDHAQITPIIRAALDDESPSVRFWAARVAAETARFTTIPDDGRQALRQALGTTLDREQTNEVIVELFKALAEIDDGTLLFEKIRNRLRAMAQGQLPVNVDGAVEGLTRFYRRLLEGRGVQKAPELHKQVAMTAWQIIELSAQTASVGNVPQGQLQELGRAIEQGDTVLRATVESSLAPGTKGPNKPVADMIKNSRWEDVLFQNRDWFRILTNAPINIKAEDLALPVRSTR